MADRKGLQSDDLYSIDGRCSKCLSLLLFICFGWGGGGEGGDELGRKEMFYLTTHSTHCIYGYMASAILW